MSCHICETIERDLQDVARELTKRRNAQARDLAVRRSHLDLEIRALSSAKADIEARYSKHRKSTPH
jgi:hypothetical protein